MNARFFTVPNTARALHKIGVQSNALKRIQAKSLITVTLLLTLSANVALSAGLQTPIANSLDLSGTWYDPATSGQGFLFDVAPNGDGSAFFFGTWFTYTPVDVFVNDTSPLWFTLQGTFQTNQTDITLPIYFNGDSQYNAAPLKKVTQVGNAHVQFQDCTHATLSYAFTDPAAIFPYFKPPEARTISLTRMIGGAGCNAAVATTTVTKSSRGFSGTWYNPATSGQGFLFDIDPATNGGFFFGSWFYRSAGYLSWLTMQGSFAPTDTEADIPMFCAPGGVFDSGRSGASGQCGTAHLSFTSCSTASLTYSLNIDGTSQPSETILLLRLTPVPADCPLN